ncbi:hypothetical protein MASSI9I_50524 [Massilia sp. 9I]|nr:hypothetical protein MASSI9I_50524 [Massilia sp. 9I]
MVSCCSFMSSNCRIRIFGSMKVLHGHVRVENSQACPDLLKIVMLFLRQILNLHNHKIFTTSSVHFRRMIESHANENVNLRKPQFRTTAISFELKCSAPTVRVI